jgi:hypothetical protein
MAAPSARLSMVCMVLVLMVVSIQLLIGLLTLLFDIRQCPRAVEERFQLVEA